MQAFDFSKLVQAIPNDFAGLRDSVDNYARGQQMGQIPNEIQEQRRQAEQMQKRRELENAILAIQSDAATREDDIAKRLYQMKSQRLDERLNNSQLPAESTAPPQRDEQNSILQAIMSSTRPQQQNQALQRNEIPSMQTYGETAYNQTGALSQEEFERGAYDASLFGAKINRDYNKDTGEMILSYSDPLSGQTKIFAYPAGMNIGDREEMKAGGALRGELSRADTMKKITRGNNEIDIPYGAQDLLSPVITPSERQEYKKQLNSNIEDAVIGNRVYKKLDRLEELVKKNPRLYQSFAYALNAQTNGEDKGRVLTYLTKNTSSKKDLTALQEMNKIVADMVVDLSNQQTGRTTDAFRSLIADTKVNPGNTPEANMAVLRSIRQRFESFPGWLSALRDGAQYDFYPAPIPDDYKNYNLTKALSGKIPLKKLSDEELLRLRQMRSEE